MIHHDPEIDKEARESPHLDSQQPASASPTAPLTEGHRASPVPPPLMPSRTMLEQEMRVAAEEFDRPAYGLLVSAISAGLGVGISLFLMAVVVTRGDDGWPPVFRELLLANALSVGFVIVILGRMDLFTEFTTIAILPVLARQASLAGLARLWGLIYVGNVIGAAIFAALTAVLGPMLGVITPAALEQLAAGMIGHPWWVVLLSASIAGWMMGVLSWLITGGRDTTSQIMFIWVVTFAMGFAHLHHSITGTAEVLAALFVGQSVGWSDFVHFLWWTTLGNALGAVLFAGSVVYSLHMRHKEAPESTRHSSR